MAALPLTEAVQTSGALPVYGVNPAAVITSIEDRAARWRRGDHAPDGRKIGLVIEGGGMRAVCSAGGAVALGRLGFREIFDEVYATSAGIMNACYFLSGQGELGITTYYDSLVTRKFLHPLRFWKILDVDYVIDHVVKYEKPLDVDAVLASRSKLFVAAIEKTTGRGMMLDLKSGRAPLLEICRAAMAIPVFYNRTVEIEGRRCMDGGLAIPFPLQQAIANGCTDLLVMLTRPASYICQPRTWANRFFFNLICAHGNRSLNTTFARQGEPSKTARDLAFGRADAPPGLNIATLCIDENETVGRTTTDRRALRDAAVRYGKKVLRAFGANAEAWDLAPLAENF